MCKVELATLKDVEKLNELLTQLMVQEADFSPNDEAQKEGLKAIISAPERGIILKLEYQEQIIGMINILYSISTALGGKVAIFEDFIISADYRGQGFGKLLFEKAVDITKTNACKRITLLTDGDNELAHRFYKNQGMEVSAMVPFRKMLN